LQRDRERIANFVLLFFGVVWHLAATAYARPQAEAPTRPVTVADAISMVRAADSLHFKEIAHFSPDGTKILVILRKGNLQQNTNDFSVVLWKTKDLFSSGKPEALLRMSSASNEDAIEDITWLQDSETFAFFGESRRKPRQVFTFNVRTHVLRRITNHPTKICSYSISAAGDTVAYIAEEPATSIFDEETTRHGLVVSYQDLYELLLGQAGQKYQLFVQSRSRASRKIELRAQIPGFAKPFLSPDGMRVVLPVYANQVSPTWKEYSDPYIREMAQQKLALGQAPRFTEYMWVDIDSGRNGIALEVPGISIAWRVVWSPDGRSIVIGDTYLPLENTEGEELRIRQDQMFTVEVELSGGKIRKIAPQGLTLLGWAPKSQRLIFEASSDNWSVGNSGRKMYFQKLQGQWTQITDQVPEQTLPSVFLEEDMNTPPRIVALNPSTKQKVILLDLNPHFDRLRFAKVDEISWKGLDGNEAKAGLYYPLDYVPGRKYPLVIQTHDWRRDRFFIDGPFTTAFAAQPLAGKNFVVLQLNEISSDESPKDVDANARQFEDAVNYLDKKGLIDRNRIGIIGFSHTCSDVEYALTHSTLHFAAASITDGFDAGYWQYLLVANSGPLYAHQHEIANGGMPFGSGLKSWLERSPSFAVDKVDAPVRIMALGGDSLLSQWEWFSALTRLSRPVEMIYLENGTHELQKPWDRMASQQGNVDWFTFWLKGEEDPDPAKRDQYLRWRKIRSEQ